MSGEPEILGKQALLDAIRAEGRHFAAVISSIEAEKLTEAQIANRVAMEFTAA